MVMQVIDAFLAQMIDKNRRFKEIEELVGMIA